MESEQVQHDLKTALGSIGSDSKEVEDLAVAAKAHLTAEMAKAQETLLAFSAPVVEWKKALVPDSNQETVLMTKHSLDTAIKQFKEDHIKSPTAPIASGHKMVKKIDAETTTQVTTASQTQTKVSAAAPKKLGAMFSGLAGASGKRATGLRSIDAKPAIAPHRGASLRLLLQGAGDNP